tara:strand:+ start:46905 stop:47687 length:783 start_codon:yes stop_codon:yes gene_type:complete
LYSVAIHQDGEEYYFGLSATKSDDVLGVFQELAKGANAKQQLKSVIDSPRINDILKNSTKNSFYSCTSNFTIIPASFFEPLNMDTIARAAFPIKKTDRLLSKFIPEIDGHIVYSISEEEISILKSNVNHLDFSHHFASLISMYCLYYAKEQVKTVFIQYHHKKFTLALFDGKQLMQFNVFDIRSFEDIIYYTYYTMEQFEFSPQDSVIHVGGKYKKSAAVLTILQRYTNSIFHLKPTCCSNLPEKQMDAIINTTFDLKCG